MTQPKVTIYDGADAAQLIKELTAKLNAAGTNTVTGQAQYKGNQIGSFLLKNNIVYYFGTVNNDDYKNAKDEKAKYELVRASVHVETNLDNHFLKEIIDDKNKSAGKVIFASKPGGFDNQKTYRMYYIMFPHMVFKANAPMSRPTSKKATASASSSNGNTAAPDAVSGAVKVNPAKMPASDNISFSDRGNFISVIRIGDIGVYTTIANIILKDLANKLKEYNITLDNPINLSLLATKIEGLANHITSVLSQNNISYSGEDYVKIMFSSSYEFISLHFVKGEIRVSPGDSPRLKPSGQASPALGGGTFFVDSTLNSVVYNLVPMFNKFGQRVQQNGFLYDIQNTIFFSADSISYFLNGYIFPKTSFVNSPVTKDLIEKFIIGDIRMLNDEVYRKSFMDPSQIPDGVRANLEKEISQGYEKIGDLLGEAWFTGKFERISDVDEFRKSLLQYIDVKELISIAVQCLLHLVPLDEWLDEICEPILKEFDKHKEGIIQELEKMDDGVAKDLATELKEIYFNRVIGEQGIVGQAGDQIVSGIKKLPERLKDADTIFSWRDKRMLQVYIDLTRANQFLVNKTMNDGEIGIPLLSNTLGFIDADWNNNQSIGEAPLGNSGYIFEETPPTRTFVYSGLQQRKLRTDNRIKDLESELNKLQSQLSVFNGVNEPQNLAELRSYYESEITKQKQKRNAADQGIEIGKELLELYKLLLSDIIPNLIVIDPYIKSSAEKLALTLSGTPYLAQKGIKEVDSTQQLKSIKELNGLKYSTVKNNGQIFSFSDAPGSNNSLIPSKTVFDSQIQNGLKLVIDRIQELQDKDEAPYNILNELENFGTGALEQTLDAILGDDTKRRKLCLAIVGSAWTAGEALYLLFRNGGEAWDFIKKEGLAITDAIEKKIEIFANVDYPYVDILEEFVDSLKLIGINFARDLIITGVMAALKELKKACSDEEKTNAPFSPIGAVDLSDFISTSKKGPNGQETGDPGNSNSFLQFSFKDGSLTKEKFAEILSAISSEFTINEMASLLDGSASDSLYQKAIDILDGLVPEVISKEGSFYKYYVNEAGIVEFFDILSQDIEPAMIARAKREFRLGKQKLLEMCAGNDFNLLGDLDDDAIRQALADNYADRIGAVPSLLNNLSNLFGENKVPDPCEMGISTLTDSQKFTARQTSETIYTVIENLFNSTAVSSKNIFVDRYSTISNYSKLPSSANAKSFFDFTQENKGDLIKLGSKAKEEFVAEPTRSAIKKLTSQDDYSFKYEINNFTNEKKLIFSLNPSNFQLAGSSPLANALASNMHNINFDYNFDENVLSFEYGQEENTGVVEDEVNITPSSVAGYKVFNYFTSSDGDVLYPSEVLFGNETNSNTKGVMLQPNYDSIIKLGLSDVIFSDSDDHYLELLNSILKDLTTYSLKTGLYKKENFLKLDLNRHITPVKLNLGDGKSPIDACFLGFANKEILHRQTEYIAKLLACRNNSATKTPFNMGYIKILFDCFIRSMVLEEMMKSFFVLGLFPQDLVFDNITPNNISLYEQIIKINVAKRISSFSPSNMGNKEFEQTKDKLFFYDTFYNNVFKKFVVDMSRVIFKNNELGEQIAYDFVINSQIQFVKNQFRKAFQNAFGGIESVIGVTEYQLLAQQIIGEASQTIDTSPLELSDGFTYNEKIRALQNDTLADFYDKTKDPQVIDGDITLGSSKNYFGGASIPNDTPSSDGNGSGFQVEAVPDVLLFDKKMPLFQRLAPGQSPTTDENPSPSGLLLDTFIELKPKTTAFTAEQRAFIELRLKYIGRMLMSSNLSIALQSGPNPAKITEFIKGIFSYTGFYMLIPQAIPFITSDNLRYKYIQSTANDEDKNIIDDAVYNDTEFGLFYWMFRYNYDPDFSKDPKAVKWYNEMVKSGLWSELNHSLTGKIKLGDFYYLLDMMEDTYNAQKAIVSLDILNKKIQSKPQLWWIIGNLIGDLNNLNTFAIFENQNIFEWLYTRKMEDLFYANTVLRIDAKLAENKNDFKITKKFAQKLFFGFGNDDVASKTDIPIQKVLLEEKVGPELLGAAGPISTYVFSTPMLELKQPFPKDLNLQSFVLHLDKFSWFQDDNFYNIFNINDETTSAEVIQKISSAANINDFLFNVGKRKGNAYSYFYRLKAFSTASQAQNQMIKNRQYLSTFWWNIKGRPIPLGAILEAIYLDHAEDETFIPVYNVNQSDGTSGIPWSEIRNALTPASLQSFILPYDQWFADLGPNFTLGKAERGNSGGTFASKEANDEGILHLSKKIGYESTSLTTVEKIKLVDQKIKELLSSVDATSSQYIQSYDEEKGIFKEGYAPFIAIKDFDVVDENGTKQPVDYGFYSWSNFSAYDTGLDADASPDIEYEGVAKELSDKYIGTDFDDAVVYAKNVKDVQHAPAGPIKISESPETFAFDHLVYSNLDADVKVNDALVAAYKGKGLWDTDRVLRGTYIKGGLGYAEEEILEKPIPGNVINIYDLFGKMLKNDNDKKIFNDLLNSFFLKEQTTIVALISRVLTELEHPQLSSGYNRLSSECYKKLAVAVAVANGDYEVSTKKEDPGPSEAEKLAKVGQILGEALLKAIASTVDPTWQTPWFTPGPLTPFGVAAKLLGEDFNFGGGNGVRTKFPPGELVCNDSLRESADFLDNFAADWEKVLTLPSTEPTKTDDGSNEQ